MLVIDEQLTPQALLPAIERMWHWSQRKLHAIDASDHLRNATPVFTVAGRYVPQGWTEWTQGFQFGSALLQFDATGDETCLAIARDNILRRMTPHLTHRGVHDHGFNNISTFANLLRLMREGRIAHHPHEQHLCELALRCSGAVQAMRWTRTADGDGFIHSFNGPHSLFCDTIRSLRSLALAHQLGHRLMDENDHPVSLLDRLVQHARTTARYNVYYGEGRDIYDVPGRVAHEAVFNTNDGRFRCPATQQGYTPFSTWTRGLAWIMLGYAELLEWLDTRDEAELEPLGGKQIIQTTMRRAATVTCDFYIANTPTDGVPYWDTGAPGLAHLGDYLGRPADPFNGHEPVDSSAAAIAAQGLVRLAAHLAAVEPKQASRYRQAGLTVLRTLLAEPYLSATDAHQGLLLHSVYHRPRGWDHIPDGHTIPCGEASMWGDYHLREVALYTQRLATQQPAYTFFA